MNINQFIERMEVLKRAVTEVIEQPNTKLAAVPKYVRCRDCGAPNAVTPLSPAMIYCCKCAYLFCRHCQQSPNDIEEADWEPACKRRKYNEYGDSCDSDEEMYADMDEEERMAAIEIDDEDMVAEEM